MAFGGGQLGTRLQKVAEQDNIDLREAHKLRIHENAIVLNILVPEFYI